jgi:2-keto-3-deoxy-L-rhamnonate aldolase RhmA
VAGRVVTGLAATFRDRLRAGGRLDGVVVRTPSHHLIEVLAAAPTIDRVDVALLDSEHAPFDLAALDACLAVAHALDMPTLVRIAELDRPRVQQALDLGATGIIVPHVDSAEMARRAVALATYGSDGSAGRGFSPSTRSAGWGTRTMADIIDRAANTTTVVIQVEDQRAVEAIDELVAVPGVDAVLLGRADLAVSIGARSVDDDRVASACELVAASCAQAGVALAVVAAGAADAERWRERGASLVFVGTDQSRLARPLP